MRSLHPDCQQKVSTLNPKVRGAPAALWVLAPARVRPTCCGGAVSDWGSGFVRAIGTAPPSPGCPQPALPRAAPRGHSTSPSRLQPPPKPGQSPEPATATGGPPPRLAQTCPAAPPPGLVPCGSERRWMGSSVCVTVTQMEARLVCVFECDKRVRWSMCV